MIRSMTGFGQAYRKVSGYKIQVDIKSVNHRYQETMVRMPREWLHLEDSLKKLVQLRIHRGRVDVFITMDRDATLAKQIDMNWSLVQGYYEASVQLQERFQLAGGLTAKDVLNFPDVVSFRDLQSDSGDLVAQQLRECTEEALSHLLEMRAAEGKHLAVDIKDRLCSVEIYRQDVIRNVPQVNDEYRAKLRGRIQELIADTTIDEHRFTTEVAMMADRANMDEELTRLLSHLKQSEDLLESKSPVGRKLDFLIQEMNREVNTMGSKSNHVDLVKQVVEMKAELEKIREQVQNVE